MYYGFYDSIISAIYTLLFWWTVFFIWRRLVNRYPENNWKRDIVLTLIQSVVVLILLPILDNIIRH
ncbi:hypothetical protein [Bacillus sinesaloumensis]|uniref:hypothetical protein n=1 Tax=Litchfieldia sinesaloumensis TaxID=1926280 RepID=UPI0009883BA6|nr:hypothetical protein [Bacillus sinesaloumensis]